MAPAVLRLAAEPARRLSAPGLAALAAGAAGLVALAFIAPLAPALPSDRSTLDALTSIAPGGPSAAVAGIGFVAGMLLVALAWRAWAPLLAIVATATILWMAVAQPALEVAISRRDSLKSFARTVAARYPPPAQLAFWSDTIRAVAVYVGRPMPTFRGGGPRARPRPGGERAGHAGSPRRRRRRRTAPLDDQAARCSSVRPLPA